MDRGDGGWVALRPLRAHRGSGGERRPPAHPHKGYVTVGAQHVAPYIAPASSSASSSSAFPTDGSDSPATLTRTFSTAPASAVRAKCTPTVASDRAFLFPTARIEIGRASCR